MAREGGRCRETTNAKRYPGREHNKLVKMERARAVADEEIVREGGNPFLFSSPAIISLWLTRRGCHPIKGAGRGPTQRSHGEMADAKRWLLPSLFFISITISPLLAPT